MLSTDFWWLSPDEVTQHRYVELFHQEPYSDEPNTDKSPRSRPMLQSDRRYLLESISQWKTKFSNINVFRSFALYTSDPNGKTIIGPFLLDVDRNRENEPGYVPDHPKALEDTRLLVEKYCFNLKDDEDCRVFFTGHKGFHIEIHPRAIGIPPNVDRWQHFGNTIKEINKRFGVAFVDKPHDHVRLHNSVNHWIDHAGEETYSMNFQVSFNDLFSLSAEDILTKAKNLAAAELAGGL